MGSGTTGVACILDDRRFIGIESDQLMAEKANERLLYAVANGGDLVTRKPRKKQ